MLYIPFETVAAELARVLEKLGCNHEQAVQVASTMAENSLEGVYTHGVNRFMRLVSNIKDGIVLPNVEAVKVNGLGGLEIWDGQSGLGVTNAFIAANRAIELAKEHGIGCIGLRNTNHWMRAGTYAKLAADAGMISIAYTNTVPNMPAWGALDARLGNNPISLGVPCSKGHVIADLAMSQFSYGKLETSVLNGKKLPMAGGFDKDGNLSDDPAAILETRRIMPTGYWKGSAMANLLDLMTSALSMGRCTMDIGRSTTDECRISQTFIVINYRALVDAEEVDKKIIESIEYTKGSVLADENSPVRIPGESAIRTRAENLKNGIPINEGVWEQITAL